ncbi:hypothetical protein HK097_010410 [Rhizophlyctis rosea]|uniref:CRAL-TRIO domain-containing protein n=1 Tax=Rhizophlyctis rosea TaxID=64517 RepID=A0AAD5X809_9FUNG|nr:hypothetical protein HK097_010410 [Rhizophlyctis rosea]
MDINAQFAQHIADLVTLRQETAKIIAAQRNELVLSNQDIATIAEILGDDALLFRFSKKHAHSFSESQTHLLNHIDYRLENRIPPLSFLRLSTISQNYLAKGLFRFTGFDKDGRLVAFINLRPYLDNPPEDLEDVLGFVFFMMDVGRRVILDVNEEKWRLWCAEGHAGEGSDQGRGADDDGGGNVLDRVGIGGKETMTPNEASTAGSSLSESKAANSLPTLATLPIPPTLPPNLVFQFTIVLDATGIGLTSFPIAQIAQLHKRFSQHFPQVFGAVYVVNYGWTFAGVWQAIKTVFSKESIGRCQFFSDRRDLAGALGDGCVGREFGGTVEFAETVQDDPFVSIFGKEGYMARGRSIDEVLAVLCADDEGYHESESRKAERKATTPILRPIRPTYISLPPTTLQIPQSPTTSSAPDIWHDAEEFFFAAPGIHTTNHYPPTSPVRSAADLQQLLRVGSGRSISSMGGEGGSGGAVGRIRSNRSLRSLAGMSLAMTPSSSAGSVNASAAGGGGGAVLESSKVVLGKRKDVKDIMEKRERKRDRSMRLLVGVVRKVVGVVLTSLDEISVAPVSTTTSLSPSISSSLPSHPTPKPDIPLATRKAKASAVLSLSERKRKIAPPASSLIIFDSEDDEEDETGGDENVSGLEAGGAVGSGEESGVWVRGRAGSITQSSGATSSLSPSPRRGKRIRGLVYMMMKMHPLMASVTMVAIIVVLCRIRGKRQRLKSFIGRCLVVRGELPGAGVGAVKEFGGLPVQTA